MIPLLTTASTVQCPHGGQVLLLTTNTDAKVDGAPVLLLSDQHAIVGCTFAPSAPSPCVLVRWQTGGTQTQVGGTPVLLQSSVGICENAAKVPQGPAVIVQVQPNGKGL
ncbi:hypothetical protein [Tahibacter sp.]|uniref:hypothetical protein n=1 Tax=Tahibacter sp. TaxID=2056211 RepID=UPI0028C470B0|nr:hypothetical protein [Tahibacter sp.]